MIGEFKDMLNQFQCTAAEFNAAAYNDVDSIVLFLCKESEADNAKLELTKIVANAEMANNATGS